MKLETTYITETIFTFNCGIEIFFRPLIFIYFFTEVRINYFQICTYISLAIVVKFATM